MKTQSLLSMPCMVISLSIQSLPWRPAANRICQQVFLYIWEPSFCPPSVSRCLLSLLPFSVEMLQKRICDSSSAQVWKKDWKKDSSDVQKQIRDLRDWRLFMLQTTKGNNPSETIWIAQNQDWNCSKKSWPLVTALPQLCFRTAPGSSHSCSLTQCSQL